MPMPERAPADGDVIRASDIGLYVYCARAWRLKAEGYASRNSAELAAGAASHAAHGWRVLLYDLAARAGLLLALLAILALILWWFIR